MAFTTSDRWLFKRALSVVIRHFIIATNWPTIGAFPESVHSQSHCKIYFNIIGPPYMLHAQIFNNLLSVKLFLWTFHHLNYNITAFQNLHSVSVFK
jgi:hypothetical protein